ncbi:MAG TPA: dihydroneopterin aldolase [Actinomycetota bacterium]|nr:dihydroneopterin aldolase [Actinomycetota bacterium]
MSDRITIRDLVVPTRIGWSNEERESPRPVSITIELDVDLRRAGATDDLRDTVDYGALTLEVADYVRAAETRLLERLAEGVAARCIAYAGVDAASVEIDKVDPPIDEDVKSVAVRVRRGTIRGT